MLSPLEIIQKYYPEDDELRRLLIHHSTQVAAHALGVAARHPELHLNTKSPSLHHIQTAIPFILIQEIFATSTLTTLLYAAELLGSVFVLTI